MHRVDARVKIMTLLALSIAVFFIEQWQGLVAVVVVMGALAFAARLPMGSLAKLSVPLLIILAVIVACNALAVVGADGQLYSAGAANGGVAAGAAAGASAADTANLGTAADATDAAGTTSAVMLTSFLGFTPAGFFVGAAYAVRILVIFVAGYVLIATTRAEELTLAFTQLLSFLRVFRVPVDDFALVLSLALRFIPLMAEESDQLHRAQAARGARFGAGGPWRRIKVQLSVVIPLVVGLFRRAERLGQAMESRCYGALSAPGAHGNTPSEHAFPSPATRSTRTHLAHTALSPIQIIACVAVIALCVTLAGCL